MAADSANGTRKFVTVLAFEYSVDRARVVICRTPYPTRKFDVREQRAQRASKPELRTAGQPLFTDFTFRPRTIGLTGAFRY